MEKKKHCSPDAEPQTPNNLHHIQNDETKRLLCFHCADLRRAQEKLNNKPNVICLFLNLPNQRKHSHTTRLKLNIKNAFNISNMKSICYKDPVSPLQIQCLTAILPAQCCPMVMFWFWYHVTWFCHHKHPVVSGSDSAAVLSNANIYSGSLSDRKIVIMT